MIDIVNVKRDREKNSENYEARLVRKGLRLSVSKLVSNLESRDKMLDIFENQESETSIDTSINNENLLLRFLRYALCSMRYAIF